MSIIFNFALHSVVFDFIIFFINQTFNKHKLIPLVFKAFKNIWQCCGCGVITPIQAVNIRNKSKEFDSIVIVLKICYNILK